MVTIDFALLIEGTGAITSYYFFSIRYTTECIENFSPNVIALWAKQIRPDPKFGKIIP